MNNAIAITALTLSLILCAVSIYYLTIAVVLLSDGQPGKGASIAQLRQFSRMLRKTELNVNRAICSASLAMLLLIVGAMM